MRYRFVHVASSQDKPDSGRTWRRWLRRGLEVVLIGAALYLGVEMLSEVGWAALEEQVRGADPSLVGLMVLLLLGRWLIWATRWQLALRRIGVVGSRFRSLVAILAAAAVNHLTPSFRIFGGLMRARYLSESPAPTFPAVYGSVLFDQIINQTVMGALSAIAFVTLSWQLGRPGQFGAGIAVVVSLVLLLPLLYRHLKRRGLLPSTSGDSDLADHVGRRIRPLAEKSREVLACLQLLFRDRTLLIEASLLGLLYALCNITAAWLAFAALGDPPPVSWVFLAVSIGVTIGAISGTPGGGLTTEAAMVTCYTLLGAEQSVAMTATLLYRGMHYILVLVLGLPSLLTLESLHRRAQRANPSST